MKKTIAWMMVAALGAALVGGCEGPEVDDEEGDETEELGETQQAVCIFAPGGPPTTDDTADLNNTSPPTSVSDSGAAVSGACDFYVLKVLDAAEAEHVEIANGGSGCTTGLGAEAYVWTRHGVINPTWVRQEIDMVKTCINLPPNPPFEGVYLNQINGEADITDTGFNQVVVTVRSFNSLSDNSTSASFTVEVTE